MSFFANRNGRSIRAHWGLLVLSLLTVATLHAGQTDQIFVVRNHATIFEVPTGADADLRILAVVQLPVHGEVSINADQTLTFLPHRDVCETQDRFSYTVERHGRTERIDVTVDILCESLTVISNFSPDGDGQNDTFTILGIQRYPGNQLRIFDGNGQVVYVAQNYNNDWSGTDVDGQPLPAGGTVYYYVLHDGGKQQYSGILSIE